MSLIRDDIQGGRQVPGAKPPRTPGPKLLTPLQRAHPVTQKTLGTKPPAQPLTLPAQPRSPRAKLIAGARPRFAGTTPGRLLGPGANTFVQLAKGPLGIGDRFQAASLNRKTYYTPPKHHSLLGSALGAVESAGSTALGGIESGAQAAGHALGVAGSRLLHGNPANRGKGLYKGQIDGKWTVGYFTPQQAQQLGLQPTQLMDASGAVQGPLSLPKLLLAQLAARAVNNPGGAVQALVNPEGTAKQFLRDTEHNLDPRNFTKDPAGTLLLYSALLAGAGSGAARLGGAAGALRSGEGLGAAVARSGAKGGSLLHAPEPGTYPLYLKQPLGEGETGPPNAVRADKLLSRNVVAREAPVIGQRARYARLQGKLDRGQVEPTTKLGAVAARMQGALGATAQDRFGRELRAQRRVEAALERGPLNEQQRALNTPVAQHEQLTRGEHAALNVVAVEGNRAFAHPDETLGRHVALHEGLRAKGVNPEENAAYIRDLKLAGPTLRNPSQKFLRALETTRNLSDLTKEKLVRLGVITEAQAKGRLVNIANVYRGANPTAVEERAQNEALVRGGAAQHEQLVRQRARALNREAAAGSARRAKLAPVADRLEAIMPKLEKARANAVRPQTDAQLKTRLAELDQRYNNFVDNVAASEGKPGDYKTVTALQNRVNGKLARSGREYAPVSDQLRQHAEQKIARFMRDRADHPAVQRLQGEIDEANAIRAELTHRAEGRTGFMGSHEPQRVPRAGEQPTKRLQTLERQYERAKAAANQLRAEREKGAKVAQQQAKATSDLDAIRARLDAHVAAQQPTSLLNEPPEGSFFFPTSEFYRGGFTKKGGGVRAPTPQGDLINEPKASAARLGPIKRRFTGRVVEHGLQLNTARNIAYRYARATSLESAHDLYDNLAKVGSKVRRSMTDEPVAVGPDARRQMSQMLAKLHNGAAEASPDEKLQLSKAELDALLESVNPKLQHADVPVGGQVPGVVWVPRGVVKDLGETSVRGAVTKALDAVTNPIRAADLYMRPAYALNAAGNLGMQLVTEGHLTPRATAYGFRAAREDGEQAVAKIDSLMGNSRSRSYSVPTGVGHAFNERLAEAWNAVTDSWSRRAAWYHEAYRAGFRTPEERAALLNDQANRGKLVEVTRRANKNLVDYDSMTPVERNVIRHAIYFYPWMSRATVWTLRTLVEHPGKAYTLAELGKIGYENAQRKIGPQPSWARQIGYIPIGPKGERALHSIGLSENPKPGTIGLLNPSSINTPQTAVQALQGAFDTAKGVVGLGKGGGLSGVLTPGAQVLASEANPSSAGQRPGLLGAIQSTPEAQALRRAGLNKGAVGKFLLGGPSKTFPDTGAEVARGPFYGGGVYVRNASKAELEKQALKTAPPEYRAMHNVNTSRATLRAEAIKVGLLPKNGVLPPILQGAYKLQATRAADLSRLPRGATQLDRLKVDLDLGVAHGFWSQQEADVLYAKAQTLAKTKRGMAAIGSGRARLNREFFGGKYISEAKRAINAHGGYVP